MKSRLLQIVTASAIAFGFIVSTNSSATVVQNPGNGHFYELVLQSGITWDDANSAANSRPGNWHLATITDADENTFIESLLAPGTPNFVADCPGSNLVGREYVEAYG